MKIGIGNDHVAVEYKKEIKKYIDCLLYTSLHAPGERSRRLQVKGLKSAQL